MSLWLRIERNLMEGQECGASSLTREAEEKIALIRRERRFLPPGKDGVQMSRAKASSMTVDVWFGYDSEEEKVHAGPQGFGFRQPDLSNEVEIDFIRSTVSCSLPSEGFRTFGVHW